ncbi:MAG TPA: nuclear transport factor 2 family protein [Fimbriimonadaceae bacterium]
MRGIAISNLETIIHEFYRTVASGDVDGALALLADDIVWTVPGLPQVPYAGTFTGKEQVADFFKLLIENEDLQTFTPHEFVYDTAGGVVCVIGSETAVALPTGKPFQARWAEIFWIKDGLISKFEEHIDTFALAQAYRA